MNHYKLIGQVEIVKIDDFYFKNGKGKKQGKSGQYAIFNLILRPRFNTDKRRRIPCRTFSYHVVKKIYDNQWVELIHYKPIFFWRKQGDKYETTAYLDVVDLLDLNYEDSNEFENKFKHHSKDIDTKMEYITHIDNQEVETPKNQIEEGTFFDPIGISQLQPKKEYDSFDSATNTLYDFLKQQEENFEKQGVIELETIEKVIKNEDKDNW